MSILDKIVASTQQRVEKDKRDGLPERHGTGAGRPPFMFEASLQKPNMAFICEIKRASPSKGIIAQDFKHLDIALEYTEAGADAISVLTEPEFFKGHGDYLAQIRQITNTPLLRKDFIVDPFQIEQSACLGADAILLICSILTPSELASFLQLADELGMSCLVEAHDEAELSMALKAGARIVGVNNRDLRTFEVDLATSIRLRSLAPSDIVFVSESGIRTAEDVDVLRQNNVDAVLVGETLMRSTDKKAALTTLRGSQT